jgi:hypothetical protein
MLKPKKLLACFIAAGFIFLSSGQVFADSGISAFGSAAVEKSQKTLNSYWGRFTKWFKGLPGIKDYLQSDYAPGNYKKAMNQMSKEYKPHLTPKSNKGL